MLGHERLHYIVDLVNRKGFINNKELSQQLGVSEATIRRDCEELERQGLLIRIHGGAKRLNDTDILLPEDEIAMSQRHNIHFVEKQIVAQKALDFIHEGDCIFLDGGTSISVIVPFLKDKKVKIVTHSYLVLNEAIAYDLEIFNLGGHYDTRYAMSVGPLTTDNLSRFNFDACFIGCAGIDFDHNCFYTAEMNTLAVKQVAMQQSNRKYLLLDSSKTTVKGFCRFEGLGQFNNILCNDHPDLSKIELDSNIILV